MSKILNEIKKPYPKSAVCLTHKISITTIRILKKPLRRKEMREERKKELQKISREIRKDVIKMITEAKSGHPGGSLSEVEIMVYLYWEAMRFDAKNPMYEDRDRFILSKGHGAPTLYAILAHKGYFDREMLWTLRKMGSPLQGHPDKTKLPGVEVSTGSLGQGMAVAGGIALAGRLDRKDYKVYVLTGDGELQEGFVWESAMSIPHYKLDRVCVIVDYNKIQIDGFVKDIVSIEPIADKFKAFGWRTMEINGHDFDELEKAHKFFLSNIGSGQPTAIIAHTIKGKGVSFMENKAEWHGVAPTPEQAEEALKELEREE